MQDSYFVLAALIVFGVIVVPALGVGFADAPGDVESNSTTIAISTDSWNAVNESDVESWLDNETVYDNSSEVNESEYRWATENGSIRAVENGTLENTSEVRLDYSFRRHGAFLELGETLVQVVLTVAAALTLLIGGGVLLSAVAAMADGGGR